MASEQVSPTKEGGERPVPEVWRERFSEIVRAFVQGNYELQGLEGVELHDSAVPEDMARYVRGYPARLIELTGASWPWSAYQWIGHCWDVIFDLETAEEGV